MVALAAITILAVLFTWLTPGPNPIVGRPAVVDGDTLRFGSTRVRLTGIDAPELDQICTGADGRDYPCGVEAKAYVTSLIATGDTRCNPSGRDRYGRTLAQCTTAGRDLAQAIAEAGWAVTEPGYAFASLSARSGKRGIWQGRFEDPADWRRDHSATEPGLWEWIRSWFQ